MKFETFSQILSNNSDIYSIPDDRLYSVEDQLYNHQKFLKNYFKIQDKLDLIVSIAWLLALLNRLHIPIEELLWRRYAYKCPRCMDIPCNCSNNPVTKLHKTGRPPSRKPENLDRWQEIISKIYPQSSTADLEKMIFDLLEDLNSIFRLFVREKKKAQFKELEIKTTDYVANMIRLFNLAGLCISREYSELFKDGCYVCHETPCVCNYYE